MDHAKIAEAIAKQHERECREERRDAVARAIAAAVVKNLSPLYPAGKAEPTVLAEYAYRIADAMEDAR